MTDKRCIFCFESDDPEDIQPLYAGPTNAQPVAWVHVQCLADYVDEDIRREIDDMDASLDSPQSKLA
jgi:hypothetical protein